MSLITAPIDGHITVTDLADLVTAAGDLIWRADGDMQIAQFGDLEPGIGATVQHPVYLMELSEGPDWTEARITANTIAKLQSECGRFQFDMEMYPLGGGSLRSLVVNTERACQAITATVGIPPPMAPLVLPIALLQPVPEPGTALLFLGGCAMVAIKRWRRHERVHLCRWRASESLASARDAGTKEVRVMSLVIFAILIIVLVAVVFVWGFWATHE